MRKFIHILFLFFIGCTINNYPDCPESDSVVVNYVDSIIPIYLDTLSFTPGDFAKQSKLLNDQVKRNEQERQRLEKDKAAHLIYIEKVNNREAYLSLKEDSLNCAINLFDSLRKGHKAFLDYNYDRIESHYDDINYKNKLFNESFKNELVRKNWVLKDTVLGYTWGINEGKVFVWDSADKPITFY